MAEHWPTFIAFRELFLQLRRPIYENAVTRPLSFLFVAFYRNLKSVNDSCRKYVNSSEAGSG